MSILITGGAGQLGSEVARQLVAKGERVVIYDMVAPGPALADVADKIAAVKGDITDLAHLLDVVQTHKVDRIVHLVALFTGPSKANPRAAVAINIGGFLNVLEVARLKDVRRVVWASSIAVFGPRSSYPAPVGDDAHHKPTTLYGACKSFGEGLGDCYREQFGVDSIALRFPLIYSPQGGHQAIVDGLVRKPLLGLPSKVPSAPAVHWGYVTDMARAVVLALAVDRTKSHAFNIAGEIKSDREAIAIAQKLIPGAQIEIDASETYGSYHDTDGTAAEAELGYRPEWTLERGLEVCVNELRRTMSVAAP